MEKEKTTVAKLPIIVFLCSSLPLYMCMLIKKMVNYSSDYNYKKKFNDLFDGYITLI